MDQKIACVKAIPMRESSNTQKSHANTESTWLATKTINNLMSKLRRSSFAVMSIKGNDMSDTIQA